MIEDKYEITEWHIQKESYLKKINYINYKPVTMMLEKKLSLMPVLMSKSIVSCI